MPTLGPDNRNRKMWFDPEMVPHCGARAPVDRHVQRIIDESTGKMIKLGDCVVLDNVVCQGIYHRFCPRELDVYWRSAWLRPLDGKDADQLARVRPSHERASGQARRTGFSSIVG